MTAATAHDAVPRPADAPPSDAACDVLRRALTLVLLDVDGWDQTTWGVRRGDPATGACRTAYCLAGHVAVHVLGCEPIWHTLEDLCDVPPRAFLSYVRFVEVGQTGELNRWDRAVDQVAEEALELSADRADLLFSESRSLRRLVELAYRFTDGRVDLLDRYAELVARDPGVARRDQATDAQLGANAARLVANVLAREEGDREGLPLEDRLGDDRTWWEDELDTVTT